MEIKTFVFLKSMPGKLKSSVVETMKTAKKVGEDDPRRIVHAMKVGFALTVVSLLYYFRPLYDGFGQAGMWAILTVVVVFEFTVGGTLSKSLNRGFATLAAGVLGIGVEYLADQFGEIGEPVVLGVFVFLLAAAATFTRFFPNVKRRYDYGVLIFILTFTMVAVSGSRVTEILQLAHQRLSTIVIGGATCMMTSVFICPVWAGEDLHNLVAGNIEKLAAFLEGFGGELVLIFPRNEISKASSKNEDKSFLQGYKSVINSKANEESLANFAWWEPPHGRFRFRHPWIQYLKIGILVRECACLLESLNGYTATKYHIPSSELQTNIQESCIKMSTESGKALRELATGIKKMTFPSCAAKIHVQNCVTAAHELRSILQNSPAAAKADLPGVMPLLFIASVMIDITGFVDKISGSVNELSQQARFKNTKVKPLHKKPQKGVKPVEDDRVVIEVHGGGGDEPKRKDYVPPE